MTIFKCFETFVMILRRARITENKHRIILVNLSLLQETQLALKLRLKTLLNLESRKLCYQENLGYFCTIIKYEKSC